MSIVWRIRHRAQTRSTNLDARSGVPGDVFTADYQTDGRGRLDHRWYSPRGQDLLMSAVLDAAGMSAAEVATLPLVAGLAVAEAVGGMIKWPNDVWLDGAKVAGILCERHDERVIVGIGVNVGQRQYRSVGGEVAAVRDRVLAALERGYERWRAGGFAALYADIAARDCLRTREVAVRQTDDDTAPVVGRCGGIRIDGALDVGGVAVFAGEAHVERVGEVQS